MAEKDKIIKVVPFKKVRNNGYGDYFETPKQRQFLIADVDNEDFHLAVAIHELIEEYDTRRHGILESEINEFDAYFEEERELGLHGEDEEPGDDERSIYREQHQFATSIEKQIVEHFGYTWDDYNKQLSDARNNE